MLADLKEPDHIVIININRPIITRECIADGIQNAVAYGAHNCKHYPLAMRIVIQELQYNGAKIMSILIN